MVDIWVINLGHVQELSESRLRFGNVRRDLFTGRLLEPRLLKTTLWRTSSLQHLPLHRIRTFHHWLIAEYQAQPAL
jgi:hypothetical protein